MCFGPTTHYVGGAPGMHHHDHGPHCGGPIGPSGFRGPSIFGSGFGYPPPPMERPFGCPPHFGHRRETVSTVGGLAIGAAIGGLAAGPVGLFIGGAIGGALGSAASRPW